MTRSAFGSPPSGARCGDAPERRLAQRRCPSTPCGCRRRCASMCSWNSARRMPGLGPDEHREHVPARCRRLGVVRGSTNTSGRCRRRSTGGRSCACRRARLSGSLSSCTQPERGGELRRLEVPADLVEDEQVVVLEVAVDRRRRTAGRRPSSSRRSAPRTGGPSGAAAGSGRRARRRRRSTMPPVPAAVMMCDEGEAGDARCRSACRSACRAASSPSASQESSITCRPCASAMARMRSQSGTLPIRFGHEDRLGARADHRLDARRRRCCRCRARRRRTPARARPAPSARCRSRTSPPT